MYIHIIFKYIILLYTHTYVYHDVSPCNMYTRTTHKAPPKKLNFDNPLAFRAFKQTITRSVVRRISYTYDGIIIILRIRVYIIIIIITTYNIAYLYTFAIAAILGVYLHILPLLGEHRYIDSMWMCYL